MGLEMKFVNYDNFSLLQYATGGDRIKRKHEEECVLCMCMRACVHACMRARERGVCMCSRGTSLVRKAYEIFIETIGFQRISKGFLTKQ